MGFYIEGPAKGKAAYLVNEHGGQDVTDSLPESFADIPEGKAMVVVVDNGPFEAAGLCYSAGELGHFTRKDDPRPRRYVLLDRELAYKLAGYKG